MFGKKIFFLNLQLFPQERYLNSVYNALFLSPAQITAITMKRHYLYLKIGPGLISQIIHSGVQVVLSVISNLSET